MARDDREYLLVELDQFVGPMTTSDRDQECPLDMVFLVLLELLPLGEPTDLDGVLELDEGGLFDLDLEGGVVHDFHHGHAES